MSTVSVIIPTWNRADTVGKAIHSALSQTVPPSEVLVCDDGSTDNTLEVIQSIKDPRIRWIAGPHGGRPAIPRNRGIAASRSEWLAFLDDDDEWVADKLEKQLRLAEQLNCPAVCSNAHRFVHGQGMRGFLLDWDCEIVTFDNLLAGNRVICSSVMIKRALVEAAGGFPEEAQLKAIEDYALWLRIAAHTDFTFINEPLVVYRDDAVNSVRKEHDNFWIQQGIVLNNFIYHYKNKWPFAKYIFKALIQKLYAMYKLKYSDA